MRSAEWANLDGISKQGTSKSEPYSKSYILATVATSDSADALQSRKSEMYLHPPRENSGTCNPLEPILRKGMSLGLYSG
jgi:hypothetical protein